MIQSTVKSDNVRRRPGAEAQAQHILDAAVALFSAQGSKAVSVSMICKQADVSRDTFYRCFKDKETLIDQLYQNAVNKHIENVLHSWQLDYNNAEWLETVFEQTIDAILSRSDIAQLLFVESADPSSPAHGVIDKAYKAAVKRIQQWCELNYGEAPQAALLQSLLVASQWLVHNAIRQGLSSQAIEEAKASSQLLFFSVFEQLKSSAEK